MEGTSKDKIVKFFEEKADDDEKKIFVGVFPSNHIIKFISFHEMMIEKGRYPFIIMNTDRSDKKGTHWWSFLKLYPRKEIFFSTALDLKVLKTLLLTTMFSIKFWSVLKNFKEKMTKSL